MDVRAYTDAFSIDVDLGGVGGSEGNIAAHGEESQMVRVMQMVGGCEKQVGKIGNRSDPPTRCNHMGQKCDP